MAELAGADGVVFEDYAKGVLAGGVVRSVIRRCRERIAHWQSRPADELEAAKDRFVEKVGPCSIR